MLDMDTNLNLFIEYLEKVQDKYPKRADADKVAQLVNTYWNIPENERESKIKPSGNIDINQEEPENARNVLETELWKLLVERGIDIKKTEDKQFIQHLYHYFEYADDKFEALHELKTYKTESNVAPHIERYDDIQKQLRSLLYKTDRNGQEIEPLTEFADNEYNSGYYPEQIDYIFREKVKSNNSNPLRSDKAAFLDVNYIFNQRGEPAKVLADELSAQPANAQTLLTSAVIINSNQETDKLKQFIGILKEHPKKFENIAIPLALDYGNDKGHIITMFIDKDQNVQIIDQLGNIDPKSKPYKDKLTSMLKELGFEESKIQHNQNKRVTRNRNDCATYSSYICENLLAGIPLPAENDPVIDVGIAGNEIDTQHQQDKDDIIIGIARLYLDDPLFCMYYKDLGHDIDNIKNAIESRSAADISMLKDFINEYKNYHLSDNVKGHIRDGNPSNSHQGIPAEEWKDEVDPHIQALFHEYEIPFKEEHDEEHPDWLIYTYEDRSIIFTKNANDIIANSYINSDNYADYLILAKTYKAMGETKVQFDFEEKENAAKMLKAAYSVGLEVVNAPDLESFRDLPEYADIKKLYYTFEYNKNNKIEQETHALMNASTPPPVGVDDERTPEQIDYYNCYQALELAKQNISDALNGYGSGTPEQQEYYAFYRQEEIARYDYQRLMHGDDSVTPPVAPILDTAAVNATYVEINQLQHLLDAENAKPTPDAAEIARLEGEINARKNSSPYQEYRQARDALAEAQKNLKECQLGQELRDAEKKYQSTPLVQQQKKAHKQKNKIMSEAIDFYINDGNTGTEADRIRVEKLVRISSLGIADETARALYVEQKMADFDSKNDSEKAQVLKEAQNKRRTAHKLGQNDLGNSIAEWYQNKQQEYR